MAESLPPYSFSELIDAVVPPSERTAHFTLMFDAVCECRNLMAKGIRDGNEKTFLAGIAGIAGSEMGPLFESTRILFGLMLGVRAGSDKGDPAHPARSSIDGKLLAAADALIAALKCVDPNTRRGSS